LRFCKRVREVRVSRADLERKRRTSERRAHLGEVGCVREGRRHDAVLLLAPAADELVDRLLAALVGRVVRDADDLGRRALGAGRSKTQLELERDDGARRDDLLAGNCRRKGGRVSKKAGGEGSRKRKSGRTFKFGADDIDDGPAPRDVVRILLVALGQAVEDLVDLGAVELAELLHRLDALLLGGGGEFGRDVRELEERRRRRVDGLEEELLEVEDRDVGREPVVRKGDRGEARAQREGDRGGEVLLCERTGASQYSCRRADMVEERDATHP